MFFKTLATVACMVILAQNVLASQLVAQDFEDPEDHEDIKSQADLEEALSEIHNSQVVMSIESLVKDGHSMDRAVMKTFVNNIEEEPPLLHDWFQTRVVEPCNQIVELYKDQHEQINKLKDADRHFKWTNLGELDHYCQELLDYNRIIQQSQ